MKTDYPDVIGTTVHGRVDRPLGSRHPSHPETVYPVNYGYIEGVLAEDGEEQDAYLLGADGPVEEFEGRVIAVYRRLDDDEDKWVVSLGDTSFSDEEIMERIRFQERFFRGVLLR
ncbi:inorganic pyrophosphatase [Coriobacteriaceae bacterium]|uniref:inorganic diphosphatase n=1 Tax=Granulimonas faecalis TaxID=2894155 RepID=UPI00109429E4|nr:inorganic pyrophosphatase [Atopobiaceae bacterium FL090493]TGY60237.1 inorganic pyrophosphatase [Coriobacteriaceae bacterium]